MKLLLDTHIWLWSALDPARLSRRVVAALEHPGNELWLSPISLWEVLTLCQKRRLILHPNPQAWIADTLDTTPMREAQITYQIAQETGRVQLPHRDPADRFLVATARVYALTLVTADEALLKARQVPVLANRYSH
jgi:PIN domain nuclease of toxin-antitoxin system